MDLKFCVTKKNLTRYRIRYINYAIKNVAGLSNTAMSGKLYILLFLRHQFFFHFGFHIFVEFPLKRILLHDDSCNMLKFSFDVSGFNSRSSHSSFPALFSSFKTTPRWIRAPEFDTRCVENVARSSSVPSTPFVTKRPLLGLDPRP